MIAYKSPFAGGISVTVYLHHHVADPYQIASLSLSLNSAVCFGIMHIFIPDA